MDWSNWTKIRDESFPSCYFDCEPESNYKGNDGERNFSFEETTLNNKACDQVRRKLLGKENAEILKIEEDITTLQNQLAWADESWSEMNTVPLSEKVKSLDLSIRNFKIITLDNDHDFGESSLVYKELLERWRKILKLLPEKYFDKKAKQANSLIIKEMALGSLQTETDHVTGEKNVSSSVAKEMQEEEEEVKEVLKSNIQESVVNDNHETGIMVKKGDFSLSTSETMRKDVGEEFAGLIPESVSSDLCSVSDETGGNEKVSKDTKGNMKTERKKVDTLGIEVSGGSLSDTLMNESGTLLEFINRKREELSKVNSKDRKNKKAKFVDVKSEPFSDLLLKPPKLEVKKVSKQKVKIEYDLFEPQNQSVDLTSKPQLKRKPQNLPGIEEENKTKGLNHNLTLALPSNSTQSSSMASLHSVNFAIANARIEETLKVLPSSRLPSATLGRMDLNWLKLADLKDLAKLMNLKGYSKLTKSELIEELSSKLTRGNCT